jgi:acid stress-induced BolA-like protein IbaG/YrbA
LVDRIKAILERSFPGIDVEVEEMEDGRVEGQAIWAGFAGLDHLDRQNEIWDAIHAGFGAEDIREGFILTYTPDELAAMKAA